MEPDERLGKGLSDSTVVHFRQVRVALSLEAMQYIARVGLRESL